MRVLALLLERCFWAATALDTSAFSGNAFMKLGLKADAFIGPSRSHSLLQSHVHRTPWTPAKSLATAVSSLASVPDAVVSSSSRRRRSVLAGLQAQSHRVNCTGLAEPCLPYQDFADPASAAVTAMSSVSLSIQGQQDRLMPAGVTATLTGQTKVGSAASSSTQENHSQPLAEAYGAAYTIDGIRWPQVWSNMLPLELHLVGTTLGALLDKYAGEAASLAASFGGKSLADLLQSLRSQLAEACKIPKKRLMINSIYGRFVRPDPSRSSLMLKTSKGLYPLASSKAGSSFSSTGPFEKHLGEEVLVRFFVLPDKEGPGVKIVVDSLWDALGDPNSTLMTGNLGNLLQHASLTVGYEESYGLSSIPLEKLSSLALPFAISAFFTGVLIWLASW